MKFQDWEREDRPGKVSIWKHTTSGIKIVLSPATTSSYQLQLFDRYGAEDKGCRMTDSNRVNLEKVAAKWQNGYCRFLEQSKKAKKVKQ